MRTPRPMGASGSCIRQAFHAANAPGTGTGTEMIRAHRLGTAVIKVFPADALGGPALVKGVRGTCGCLKLMPSGA